MRQLNKNEKLLGVIAIVALFIFMFISLILNPLREKLSAVEQELTHSQLLIRKYLELEHQKDFLLTENKKIERYLNLKGSNDEKMGAIISKIEIEAKKSGLVITDMKPDIFQESKSLIKVYRIQLNAEADIVKIVNFVYNLENADILFKFDKFNLSIKDANTNLIKIEANILAIVMS